MFKCWLIKTVKTDWSLELIWLIFFRDEGRGVSSLSKHLEFKISYLEGPSDHDSSLGEGGLNGISKLNQSLPEIFLRGMLPLSSSRRLASSNETLPLLSWLCIFWKVRLMCIVVARVFSSSLKPYDCMKRGWAEHKCGVVEEPTDFWNPADLGLKLDVASDLKQTIKLPLLLLLH